MRGIVVGRAKKKMEDLERLFEIAKQNFVQLGGHLEEDKKRMKEEKELERLAIININFLVCAFNGYSEMASYDKELLFIFIVSNERDALLD
jgi:hypothetical protein